MKKFLVAIMFGLMAIAAQAEATFDQVETLIQQKNYAAASAGLEVIIQNHPKSAKAFYAMAQAQAGLGNLEKAQKALNIATGLNPTLDFAPASSVASLKEAITPQTAKIEAIEETHFWRNFAYFALFAGFGGACYFFYSIYARKRDEEEAAEAAKLNAEAEERIAARAKAAREDEARRAALRAHPNYGNERFDPSNPDVLLPKKTKAQLKAEADALALREAQARAEAAEADARRARSYSSTPSTTVVNNSSNDMLTGVLIGNMLSGSHHDHTTIVEKEVIREVPSKNSPSSIDSSWDDTSSSSSSRPSSSSRSSSWDSDSSPSSSSSWSSSSDSSSSSWDSGSSSSSSSWD